MRDLLDEMRDTPPGVWALFALALLLIILQRPIWMAAYRLWEVLQW